VSSLWTPDGERPVRRTSQDPAGSAPTTSNRSAPPPRAERSTGDADPADAAAALARLREELSSVPAAVVVANHAYGLFELAAIHLASQPPNLPDARLAVDALGALVDGLGDRLGEATAALNDALAQIRLAYVQLSAVADVPAPSPTPPRP
jgi:hypothetical protein